ncbi:protein SSUH2 homolog [Centruroides vittatus]|uniref:protein SSUH2 homolog n=1 Tax=Centruroides vittatus TaxID=120091 RepID=UPI003510441B
MSTCTRYLFLWLYTLDIALHPISHFLMEELRFPQENVAKSSPLFTKVPPTAPPWSPSIFNGIPEQFSRSPQHSASSKSKVPLRKLYVATVHPQVEPWQQSSSNSWQNAQLARLYPYSPRLDLPQEAQSPNSATPSEIDSEGIPIDFMDKIPGYEYVTFTAKDVPPPEHQEDLKEQPKRTFLTGYSVPTESEAREILYHYLHHKCCFSTDPLKNTKITKITNSSVYFYRLESFTEKRQVVWVIEPFSGGLINEDSSGKPPQPWDIPCAPPTYFLNFTTHIIIPCTLSIKNCNTCNGGGQKYCYACTGNGWENCYYCQGLGYKVQLQGESEKCQQCLGTGKKKCWKCNGESLLICKLCQGSGQIKCYIQLIVSWINHKGEEISEEPTISKEKLRTVSGQIIFQEEQTNVWPILHFHNEAVNRSSEKLINTHKNIFSNEKCLMQRHQVKTIPITTVNYIWRRESGFFTIYGLEKVIYAPHFPRFDKISCIIL